MMHILRDIGTILAVFLNSNEVSSYPGMYYKELITERDYFSRFQRVPLCKFGALVQFPSFHSSNKQVEQAHSITQQT
jgi:hypothetical protein